MSKLSMQQSLVLAQTKFAVKGLSREKLEAEFIGLLEVMMTKENAYKQMILENAGIVTPIFEGKK